MIQNKHKPRVIIVANQYLVRIGIKSLIRNLGIEPDYVEVGSFDDVTFNDKNDLDYLIVHYLQLNKPRLNYLHQLRKKFKGRVLVIGNSLMDKGFHQYLIHPNDSQSTITGKFQQFFSTINQPEETVENAILSAREIDILKEVALGYSNKEIADRLFISINTVITHRKNITDKLGIKTISGLTVYALMNNLINPEDVTI